MTTTTDDDDLWYFNGIDAVSGGYSLPPMTLSQVFALAAGGSLETGELADLTNRQGELARAHAGVEVDPRNLAETGWGVIFASDEPQLEAIRERLQPLLARRQAQAGERYHEYSGLAGYQPGESKMAWLARHAMGPGPVNPERVPYYLLLVGDPARIPYSFQYQLDVQYAVGRLSFERLNDYAAYASSVVTAETRLALHPTAAFFGAANPDDRATQLSLAQLIQPLATRLAGQFALPPGAANPAGTAWEFTSLLGDAATKANLSELLHSPRAPSLLFSATHGLSFPSGHPRQLDRQGALLCQDWPGPHQWQGPIPEDFAFSAADLGSQTNLLGTIAFLFACYGAGTPAEDEFVHDDACASLAPRPFLSRLPMRMLSLPRGGALAVVGHVARAWGCSFAWGGAGPQLQVFEDGLARLLKDYPVGYAMEVFNNRYAEISSELMPALDRHRDFGQKLDRAAAASLWTANNDARNYMLLGDPAVRLPVSQTRQPPAERPTLESLGTPEAAAAAPLPPAAAVPEPLAAGALDYGLLDNLKQTSANVGGALQRFTEKLGAFMSQAIDEAASLEVTTYVADDLSQFHYQGGQVTGAQPRAWTRISLDGDVDVVVPSQDGEIDVALWAVHSDMVKQAQAARAELLKTVISAGTGLMSIWKP